jgi:hypothetical protein
MSAASEEEAREEDVDAFFVSYKEVRHGKLLKFYLTSGGGDAREAGLALVGTVHHVTRISQPKHQLMTKHCRHASSLDTTRE